MSGKWQQHVGSAAAAVLFAAVLLVLLVGNDATDLLGRTFTLDESLTHQIVSDPSVSHMFKAVAAGVDTNPPGLHVLARLFCAALGDVNHVNLRLFALTATWLTMFGLFLLLRRSCGWWAAAVAPLVLYASTIGYTLDARFYMPWCAATVWFMLALRASAKRPTSMWQMVLCGLAALVLGSLHYFALLSWGLVAGAFFIFSSLPTRQRVRVLLPTLAGPVVTFVSAAVLIPTQKAGMTLSSYMDPLAVRDLPGQIIALVPGWALGVTAIAAWASVALLDRHSQRDEPETATDDAFPTGPVMASQLLVPVVLYAFSLLVQPAYEARYMITFAIAITAVAGWLLQRAHAVSAVVVAVALLATASLNLRQMSDQANQLHRYLSNLHTDVEAKIAPADTKLVFLQRFEIRRYVTSYPQDQPHAVLFNFTDERLKEVERWEHYDRDLARKVSEVYDYPRLIEADELQAMDSFYVYARPDHVERFARWIGAAEVSKVNGWLQRVSMSGNVPPADVADD